VRYPQLPEPFDPQPDDWVPILRAELAAMRGERIVLCHSLGCLLWLVHARDAESAVDRALLVAPPYREDVEPIMRFHRRAGAKPDDVRRAARLTRMACAPAGDPYCPRGAVEVYGGLGLPADLIPGGAHLNADAGYGPWPAVEQWALGERDDLEPR